MDPYHFKPIGYLKSCYQDKFGTPRQPGLNPHSTAQLQLRADIQPELALQDLEGFSHVWLVFVFHLNNSDRYHAKVHPPRLGGETKGVFSTRSPHRPNPIGLSLVKLDRVEKDSIFISGIDLVNETPVLDIKPYLPEIESIPEAKIGWLNHVVPIEIHVQWSEKAVEDFKLWTHGQTDTQKKQLIDLIEKTLQLDPRPTIYKGFEGSSDSPYRSQHGVRLYDRDIRFTFVNSNRVEVIEVVRA